MVVRGKTHRAAEGKGDKGMGDWELGLGVGD